MKARRPVLAVILTIGLLAAPLAAPTAVYEAFSSWRILRESSTPMSDPAPRSGYWIDEPTLEMLAEHGVAPELVERLRHALAGREGFDVAWREVA